MKFRVAIGFQAIAIFWIIGCSNASATSDSVVALPDASMDTANSTDATVVDAAKADSGPADTGQADTVLPDVGLPDGACPVQPSLDATVVDAAACGAEAGALASCLAPQQPAAYYVEQGLKYFDTLDSNASKTSIPNYSTLSARWEWPPWLKLTGWGKQTMTNIGYGLAMVDPSSVPVRDCRAFCVQPFARCHVIMQYSKGSCPIYEEFTFNNEGEMTFIEAWSDLPGKLPMADSKDRWGEGPDVAVRAKPPMTATANT